jgi:hypothetical protein
VEDVLTCNICFERYDEDARVPLILKCGHTVCKECAKQLACEFLDKKCPFDKTYLDYRNVDTLKKNFSVLDLLEAAQKKKRNSEDRKCDLHPTKKIKFYCRTHSTFVCSDCLVLSHIGHEVEIARPLIIKENVNERMIQV